MPTESRMILTVFYKEKIPNRRFFWSNLKKTLLSGENFAFNFSNVSEVFLELNCVLQTNVWKMEP